MPSLALIPRKTAAVALGLAARGMELGAFAAKLAAQRLGQAQDMPGSGPPRGDEGPGPLRVAEARLHPPAEERGEAGRVSAPPTDPVAMVDPHARTYETHAAELADKPAAQLIRAIRDLSTDELRGLYEHEQANKKRKSVLKEIENQLAPIG
jgi:hypothetical protein